ncbi:Hypothetical protein R9X50_00092100 [Acrodontium crateriforme]|uniref:Transmembrane protein n=1 Tax=Acrodontium crateriforme TaxID=150365 RepID=A0AAQ3M1G8_9PEZI|nr:Hypothetical protein R9X50_00092100 [Acrodontium crateriforme]
MSPIMSWSSAPVILILSIPLACFAICTTFVAFWVLYVRLVILYFEMAYAIFRSYFIPTRESRPIPQPPVPEQESPSYTKRHHRRMSSASSRAALAIHQKKSQSFAGLRGAVADKDFEGLGGWYLSSSDDDSDEKLADAFSGIHGQAESSFAGLVRREKPYFTLGDFTLGGSQASSGRVSPEAVRTPMLARTTGNRIVGSASGTTSPESYFNFPISSQRSLTALSTIDRNSRVGFDMSQIGIEDRWSSRNNDVANLAEARGERRGS